MKRFIVAIVALLATTGAFAQGFGIVGGLTSSQVNVKQVDVKSAAGFHAGSAYCAPLGRGFAIQPELLYNVKGSNMEELKANSKLGFVELPVQVQWGFKIAGIRPYVFMEPFVGYAITGNEKIGEESAKIIMKDVSNRLEYGLGTGIGIQLFNSLQVSLKYFWNFDDASLNTYIDTAKGLIKGALDDKSTNSFDGIVISAGIFF